MESWVAERPAAELHFSAVGEAELRYAVAIVRSRGMAVAIRNVRDFGDIEVEVFNPWTAAPRATSIQRGVSLDVDDS